MRRVLSVILALFFIFAAGCADTGAPGGSDSSGSQRSEASRKESAAEESSAPEPAADPGAFALVYEAEWNVRTAWLDDSRLVIADHAAVETRTDDDSYTQTRYRVEFFLYDAIDRTLESLLSLPAGDWEGSGDLHGLETVRRFVPENESYENWLTFRRDGQWFRINLTATDGDLDGYPVPGDAFGTVSFDGWTALEPEDGNALFYNVITGERREVVPKSDLPGLTHRAETVITNGEGDAAFFVVNRNQSTGGYYFGSTSYLLYDAAPDGEERLPVYELPLPDYHGTVTWATDYDNWNLYGVNTGGFLFALQISARDVLEKHEEVQAIETIRLLTPGEFWQKMSGKEYSGEKYPNFILRQVEIPDAANICLSPDLTSGVYTVSDRNPYRVPAEKIEFRAVDLKTGETRPIGDFGSDVYDGFSESLANDIWFHSISPDGTRALFEYGEPGDRSLWIINLE